MSGFKMTDLLERIQEMGGDVDSIVQESLKQSADRATSELRQGIARHRRTGRTEDALIDSPTVQNVGGKYYVKVGFKLPQGLPARYINKGTPTNTPDPFVDKAMNKAKFRREQIKAFERIIGK